MAVRLQLSSDRRRALILLVDHHLTLSSTAQRRNLDDPATILEFAQVVKDQPTLDALMLLTLADGQGTSDEAWSDWKESLVWQLYRSTRRLLAEGEGSVSSQPPGTRQAAAGGDRCARRKLHGRDRRAFSAGCPIGISKRRMRARLPIISG